MTRTVFSFIAAALALVASPATAQEERPLPLHVELLNAPALAIADGNSFLVYELHITNWYAGTFELVSIDVLDEDAAPLMRYADARLADNLKHFPAASDTIDVTVIEPGRRVALMAWIPIDAAHAPASLRHRITVRGPTSDATFFATTSAVPVRVSPPVVIGPPLRGGPWIVGNAPNPSAVPGHSRLTYPRGARIVFPQRFSADWLLLGPDGRIWHDEIGRNESWYTYGQDVLAVADGVVSIVRDSIAENTPPDITTPMTQATVAGNIIVLDIGGGRWAVYGHLQPGSIRARPGDRVRRGDVIARVGNSGFSTGPHLHFHIIDGASHAAGEGLPFVIDRYVALGRLSHTLDELEGGAAEEIPLGGVPRERDLPTDGSIVRLE